MPSDRPTEEEANLFAMLLLMPEKFVAEDVKNGIDLGNDEYINRLAKKYQVTKTMAALRIAYYFRHKN